MSHVRIKVVRKFVPHAMLLNAASRALESGKNKTEAFWWDWLATILYCSLSVEAIGNTYGETFIPQWQHFASASPVAKIRLVAEHCRLQPDFAAQPWSIVPKLIRFRNAIAHAKLEDISVDATYPKEDYEKYLYAKPESKLEKMVTQRLAQQSFDCISEILRLFANGLPSKMLFELQTGGWHGGAEPATTVA
jgi:hypothetical protein